MALSEREWERIKMLVSLSNFTYDYTNIHLKDNSKRKYLTDALERHGGLKDMFRDLYENPDTRFIYMYKESFSSTFGFHRRQILPDKYINTFNYLFMFLEAYRFNRNDFDNFNAIVKDILSCSYSNEFLFDKVRWNMIDRIISNTNYNKIPELSRFFKYVLTSSEEEFKDSYLYYRSMMMMVDSVLYNDGDETFDVANNIIKYSLDNYHREEYPVSIDLVYSDILLFGNRFSYLNNKLKEIEPNIYIRRDIFSRITSFSKELFNALSKDEDYLIRSLDIVFDSDTYTELISKLNVLSSASSLYDSGKFKEASEMIFLLDDLCHKETFNGKVIQHEYAGSKPVTIIERMADLYSEIDPSKSKESILDIHANSLSIGALYVGIGTLNIGIEEDKSESVTLEKPKSKIKSFVDRFIPRKDI